MVWRVAVREVFRITDNAIGATESVLLAALMMAITVVVFLQVLLRYVFDISLIWSDELSRHLLVWVSFIGAAAAVRLGAHFGMSLALDRLPRHWRGPVIGFGTLVIAIFALVLLIYGAMDTTNAARQYSITLPYRMHWAYLAIPVGSALILWHLFARLVVAGPWAEHTSQQHLAEEREPHV